MRDILWSYRHHHVLPLRCDTNSSDTNAYMVTPSVRSGIVSYADEGLDEKISTFVFFVE